MYQGLRDIERERDWGLGVQRHREREKERVINLEREILGFSILDREREIERERSGIRYLEIDRLGVRGLEREIVGQEFSERERERFEVRSLEMNRDWSLGDRVLEKYKEIEFRNYRFRDWGLYVQRER